MPEVVRTNVDAHEGHASPSPGPFHQTSYNVGSPDVFTNDEATVRIGDTTVCGDPADAGSPNVFINEIPVHRRTDATAGHGSWVPNAAATGSPNVWANESAGSVAARAIFGTEYFGPEDYGVELYELSKSSPEEMANNEPGEYGDGGQPAARFGNTSPTNGVSGPQPAPGSTSGDGTTESPSPQPSNEDGQYIKWLDHVDSRVKPQVVTNLEQVSQEVGYQLQVTSGYRSPEYNARVGGAKNSQHVQGNATDIVQSGLTVEQRQAFISAAIDAGFTAIGVYNTFTHVDIRGGALRAWGDTGSWRSLPKFPWALEILQAKGYNYPG